MLSSYTNWPISFCDRYLEERKKRLQSRKQHKDPSIKDFTDFQGNLSLPPLPPSLPPSLLNNVIFPSDKVKFNEVVPAPPWLSAKPRSSSKRAKHEVPDLSFIGKLQTRGRLGPGEGDTLTPVREGGLKRRQDLEEERERVIEEYRQAKKHRTALTKDRTPTWGPGGAGFVRSCHVLKC